MTFRQFFNYARTLSFPTLVSKTAAYAARRVRGHAAARSLAGSCTYAAPGAYRLAAAPERLLTASMSPNAAELQNLIDFSARAAAAEFNLLGSGWTRVDHGADCPGFEGSRWPPGPPDIDADERISAGNRERARSIRGLIDAAYTPIDWQLDFRSGYRWDEGRPCALASFGHLPSVDIKVPWELARCQHLPWLALAWRCAEGGRAGFADSRRYRAAFRNQVLDFLAANPPGYGVNWACAMDVAIRAANLALARWLFGDGLDAAFDAELAAGLAAHGRHVAANLEWAPAERGNHYLANLAGLAFVGRALAPSPETDTWLSFAAHELNVEIERQFTPDGANFEGSSCYHRLSAETVLYTAALLLGLDAQRRAALAGRDPDHWPAGRTPPGPAAVWDAALGPFTAPVVRRLERMAAFSLALTKPNGAVQQIGDNDNGRLFKVGLGHLADGEENHLDHRGLAAAAAGLFPRPDYGAAAGDGFGLETATVAGLAAGRELPAPAGGEVRPAATERPGGDAGGGEEIIVRLGDPAVLDGLETFAFPDFGVYGWRGPRFFLAVRCGAKAHDGRGGHAHNDQLAIELNVDGDDWLADPGSYVYTAQPERRDAYRSVRAHAAPRDGEREPGRLDLGMFRLGLEGAGRCWRFAADGFDGWHDGFGRPVHRSLRIGAGRIRIRDRFGGPIDWDAAAERTAEAASAADLRALMGVALPFSPGYGLRASPSPSETSG